MEFISLQDLLNHYAAKLSETIDDFEACRLQIKVLEDLIAEGWQGAAAAATRDKLERSKSTIDGMYTAIQNAQGMISDMTILEIE